MMSAVPAGNAEPAATAEFHLGRLIFSEGLGIPGYRQWWAIDYPEAERHFVPGLARLTGLDVADDSRHVRASENGLFDHPFLFVQQPGKWQPDASEVRSIREYLLRGGFILFDDLHGTREWSVLQGTMARIVPEYPIVELTEEDAILNVVYELRRDTQIPGRRHLHRAADGSILARLEGPQAWRGIHDENGRLMVAINFNMDMGDAWQHADDPLYPEPMTALAYRFGVNYVVYAMTH